MVYVSTQLKMSLHHSDLKAISCKHVSCLFGIWLLMRSMAMGVMRE